MKWEILIALLCLVGLSQQMLRRNHKATPQSDYQPKPFYFEQLIDHFDPENTQTFTQKFYYNTTYWSSPDGPIFLEISGEAPCDGIPPNMLQIYAQQFGAMIVTLEHRYYGESLPFQDQQYENLQFLTTKQALEDLAYFIQYFRTEVLDNSTAPLITFGCSYAGALSAWFRLKYPHLTLGTVSSSGVVNTITDFYQFDLQIGYSVGSECANTLREVTKLLENRLNAGAQSNAATKKDFQADGFSDGDFFWLVADIAAESVQYGFQDLVCNSLNGLSGNQLYEAYLNFSTDFFYPVFLGGDVYSYSTIHLQDTSASNGDRTWWWQECSELGFFQNAPSVGSIRSSQVNMTYHRWRCDTAFGHNTWPTTDLTNLHYGGADIRGTNIYFLQSSQDPWQWAGVRNSVDFFEPADIVFCENCGHCSDLRGCPSLPPTDINLEGCQNQYNVDDVRKKIVKFISILLDNHNQSSISQRNMIAEL
eukprot:TRINITY_DN5154_c0_g1_i1.p1 TRINITY_DN5154_c0_g1~~TRINITY_DN5154_c0_g1_i1.p1  ORF type:complete len:477 (-),score=52.80 TRINITY_DN5154_c0_g1_i1:62-1492(-)